MSSLPFILDFRGDFAPGSIRVRWDGSDRPPDPAIEELKAVWPAKVEEIRLRGGRLYNGPMVRYLGHELSAAGLLIHAGPTDYATFLCTNYLNHARGDEIGWDRFANPIGISANVITSDGWLLYGRRGLRVACHPATVHAFGGTLDPTDLDRDGRLDVFTGMDRELREELNLARHEAIELRCLGLIRDRQIRQPELIFDARLDLPRSELESRFGPDDPEHEAIVAVRDEPSAPVRFLQNTPAAVPILVGAVWLHECQQDRGP